MIDYSDAKLIITDEDAKEILNELDTDAYIIENCGMLWNVCPSINAYNA